MFFLLQRALMFHSSSTYHYSEQTWLYVFAVALERFNHLYGYREKSWTTLFPAGCPFLCCEFWLYACSALLFHNPNWTREELFVIRAQNYRWSNNSLYYRLKSLGIFKYRSEALVFLQSFAYRQIIKLSLPFFHGVVGLICVPHNFRQTFGSARLARKPSYNSITIESQATVPKISTVKPAASST